MAEDAAEPIDDDSIEMLGDAKKGKARNFVMICKGVRILKLSVFKKGQVNAKVQAAKKEGFTGNSYWGVVTGKGNNLRFELSSEEGFDKPPGKELILKDFLKSKADFKCDPEYVIVKELAPVDEDDEREKSPETSEAPKSKETPPEVPPDAPPPPPTVNSDVQRQRGKITELFARLSPKVPDFVREFPDRRVEILKPVKRVKDFLDDEDATDVDGAKEAIKTISQLLGSVAGSKEKSPIPEAPPEPEVDSTQSIAEFKQRVMRAGETAKKLEAPPDVMALVRQAVQQLKDRKTAELEETLGELEPRLITLERSAQAKNEIEQATGRGNVRLKSLKMDWERSRAKAEGELQRLIDEILSNPEVLYDPRRNEIQAAARNLIKEMPQFDKRLETLLDRVAKSEAADESANLQREALDVIDGYLKEIEGRPLLRQIEDTFFGKASISSELNKTLVGLREVLASRA